MKIEEKFNKQSAKFVEIQPPHVTTAFGLAHGIKVMFFPTTNSDDPRQLAMYLSPLEAIKFAESLISAARLVMDRG